nr:MAG TPA: tail assembly chaperone protein [Caudoviricetes sp.]
MSIVKKIEIDGKEVAFKASAAIPRIYRLKFQRDIYKDLSSLEKAIGDGDVSNSNLNSFSLEMFENIAFVMAKHADPSIPDTPEEWLDEFNTFSIYQVLPQLIELWGLNVKTDVEAKKNFVQQSVK